MAPKRRRARLQVIALAATKGGVGKTTLSAALAVHASKEGRVALIDLDPQESLAEWYGRRDASNNPKLIDGIASSSEAIELLISEGWDYVIIDTPPAILDMIEPGIVAADLVLIPTRPSALDLTAISIVEELCQAHHKPYRFVLNQCMPNWRLTSSAVDYMAQTGRIVLEPRIAMRQAYPAGMTVGKSAAEVDRGAAASGEIAELWQSVKSALSQKGLSGNSC